MGAVASVIKHDVERFGDVTYEEKQGTKGELRRALGVIVFILLISIVIFVLNIVGIVYEFKCKYIALGIVSIVGMFFGLPIGLIFYIVYLVNPSICSENA